MLMRLLGAATAAMLFGGVASAASLTPLGPQNCDVPDVCAIVNTNNNTINQQVTPNTMATWAGYRNYLDNGDMSADQVGTGTVTGGTTSIAFTAMAADRWFISTNVGSGAGQAAVITASPAPPPGFQNSVKMWRNSGSLTQQVCAIQEIETPRAVQLQGQAVIFSMYAQPLAGLTSANGAVQVYIISGTDTDAGLGTLTASPAVTPAWTGIAGGTTPVAAGAASPSWNLGTTAAWSRVYTVPFPIPLTATEVGVEICFTPVGSSSGATDGFAFVGAQLEVAGPNAIAPSVFEQKPPQVTLAQTQRFFYRLNEPGALALMPLLCGNVASGAQNCQINLPVPMRGTTPVVTIPTTGTIKQWVGGSGGSATWTSPTAGVCSTLACGITSSTTDATVGNLSSVVGAGGAGLIQVVNDKIM